MKSKRRIIILSLIVIILLLPLIAMQFTDEVKWSFLDFSVAGILLLASGLTFELILRKVKPLKNRIIIVAALLILLVLIWAELAVGIFNTPLAGN